MLLYEKYICIINVKGEILSKTHLWSCVGSVYISEEQCPCCLLDLQCEAVGATTSQDTWGTFFYFIVASD